MGPFLVVDYITAPNIERYQAETPIFGNYPYNIVGTHIRRSGFLQNVSKAQKQDVLLARAGFRCR